MTRLIIFLSFLVGGSILFSLQQYKKFAPSSQGKKYIYAEAKKSFNEKQALKEELILMKQQTEHSADVEKEVEEKPFTLALDTPALKKGSELFKKCVVCHGPMGQGKKAQKAPAIGGQHAWYIESALNAMKKKERINKVMDPYLMKLSSEDFSDLAQYISKLPWKKGK